MAKKPTEVDEEEIEETPAAAAPTPKAKNAKAAGDTPANKWQGMLDQLASGAAGPCFFLKAGRTRIRLIPEPGTEDDDTPTFFHPVDSTFRGRTRTKFLLSAIVISAEGRELSEDRINAVLPVVVPKNVLADILNALADGWDLFDPEDGHGISIAKTGSGLNTEYSVNISPKPYLVDPEEYKPMDGTLAENAVKFAEFQAARADQPSDDSEAEEEAPASAGKKNRSSMGGAGKGKGGGGGKDW